MRELFDMSAPSAALAIDAAVPHTKRSNSFELSSVALGRLFPK